MPVQIGEIGPERLAENARVPIKFEVRSILQVLLVEGGLDGMLLRQKPVDRSTLKDFESYGELPTDWLELFDVINWASSWRWMAGHRAVLQQWLLIQLGFSCSKAGEALLCYWTFARILPVGAWGSRFSGTQLNGPERGVAGRSRFRRKFLMFPPLRMK